LHTQPPNHNRLKSLNSFRAGHLETYFSDTEDITVQYSLFYEPLDGIVNENEGRHGYGPLLGNEGHRQSFHHNVVAHVRVRAPRLANVQDVDVINNIVFNWKKWATRISNGSKDREPASRINVVNNVYRPGSITTGAPLSMTGQDADARHFFAGNEDHLGFPIDFVEIGGSDPNALVGTPNLRPEYATINTELPFDVWHTLLGRAGARVPVLDEADALFIQQIRDGGGTLVECVDLEDQGDSILAEPCEVESALGYYPVYLGVSRPEGFDTDGDGMPDSWELTYGLNPDDPNDRNGDMVGDGWTNLEYYLNHLAGDYEPVPAAPVPATVPDVVGLAQAAAETAITDAALTVGTVTDEYSDTVPIGAVTGQNPVAAATVAAGSVVALAVSLGPAPATVPDVVGLAQAAAETAITDARLTVGTVTQETSDTVPVGAVISQNPVAGTTVAAGSAVALAVSLGPAATVPDVVGLAQAAAETAITDVGLTVGAVTQETSDTVPAGAVISQNPVAGTTVAVGSAVALVVSLGPPVTVPDVVGLAQAAAQTAITDAGLAVGAAWGR
jgi:beta-lactam-binding protein with PASTA domain